MGGVAEVEALEQVLGTVLPALEPAQARGELEVLPGGGARHETADVGAVAGEALDGDQVLGDVEPVDPGSALARRDDPGQHAHGGGLAGPVATQESRRPSGVRRQVDAPDSGHRAEPDPQPLDLDPGLALAHVLHADHSPLPGGLVRPICEVVGFPG